jgi:type V secretory pathway adhesin AidA
MKRQAFSLVSLLTLLLVAGSAIAQTVHVRGNIPFNFAVGSKTFPAGTYDIGSIDSGAGKILVLQARDSNTSMMLNSNAAENLEPADKTMLGFNQYGNRYFLSQIWVAGETRGHQLPKTSREKEMARDVAQNLTQGRVEIMASLQ